MKNLLTSRVIEPLKAVMRQGLSRESMAFTLAGGFVIATFPVFGSTTLLCALFAAGFRLNQVVIQIANYIGYPFQFLLFIPLIRIGEELFGLPSVSIDPATVGAMIWDTPLLFVQTYGVAIGAASVVWLVLAVPAIWVLKQIILLLPGLRVSA